MTEENRPNILFIITDQQRADCMSSLGHPIIRTPNLDNLAERGVLFSNAYIQSSPCGPSRICLHTGRYVHAHRSTWNEVSLPADEKTTGTYFSDAGYRVGWVGKSGYVRDDFYTTPEADTPTHGHEWYAALRGTEDWAFDMGGPSSKYRAYLRDMGYAEGTGGVFAPDGEILNSNEFRAAKYPTVIPAEHSLTAWCADRTMAFIAQASQEDNPWMLVLNWSEPHSPFVAPAPYHEMYDPADVPAPNRHPDELVNGHPLHQPLRRERRALPFDDEALCRQHRAAYYGTISLIDDQLGRLVDFLAKQGLAEDTIIVFTSDHGEYIGDHWLIEKEFWYDEAYRIPLIFFDPSHEADGQRGTHQTGMVEQIDVLPTLMEAAGLDMPYQIHGRSLLPMIRQGSIPGGWRTEVHADWDFRFYWASRELGLSPDQCRAWMIRDQEFNYVHFNGLPDILYDLEADPCELRNVVTDSRYREVVESYRLKLLDWRMSTEDNTRIGWTYERRPKFGMNPFRFRSVWPPYL